jgi:hypothetical protein
MPRPTENRNRTIRSRAIPATAPARPVARPSCHDPAGSQSGSGCHTGHAYAPRVGGIASGPAGGGGIGSGDGHGNGHGITPPGPAPGTRICAAACHAPAAAGQAGVVGNETTAVSRRRLVAVEGDPGARLAVAVVIDRLARGSSVAHGRRPA